MRNSWVHSLLACVMIAALGAFAIAFWKPSPSIYRWPTGTFGLSERDIELYTVGSDQELRLFWKDERGKQFGRGAELYASLLRQNVVLKLAMNSGIYIEAAGGCRPLGLHIEQGAELVPAEPSLKGYGNFYMQPKGMFCWGDSGVEIVTTEQYLANPPEAEYGLQSGPMLLIDGEINSAFDIHSENGHLRAGVGVDEKSQIYLAVSNTPVTLYEFAEVFKKSGCGEALYLDGAIIGLYISESNVDRYGGPMAGILGVVQISDMVE